MERPRAGRTTGPLAEAAFVGPHARRGLLERRRDPALGRGFRGHRRGHAAKPRRARHPLRRQTHTVRRPGVRHGAVFYGPAPRRGSGHAGGRDEAHRQAGRRAGGRRRRPAASAVRDLASQDRRPDGRNSVLQRRLSLHSRVARLVWKTRPEGCFLSAYPGIQFGWPLLRHCLFILEPA